MPFLAFAQVGYGGGGQGNGPIFGSLPTPNNGGVGGNPFEPEGRVLGASTFRFTTVLWRGMSGDDVVELQKILIAQGFLNTSEPTGFFGLLTEAAVKAYQNAHGIEPIGIVGPLTRAALNKDLASAALPALVMSQSARVSIVKEIEMRLAALITQFSSLLLQQ